MFNVRLYEEIQIRSLRFIQLKRYKRFDFANWLSRFTHPGNAETGFHMSIDIV